jgi:hypothetical protein
MTITKHREMLKKCYKRIQIRNEIDFFATGKQNLINKRILLEKRIKQDEHIIDVFKQLRAETLQHDIYDKAINGLVKELRDNRRDLRDLLCNGDEDDFQERLDNADARILFLRTRLLTDLKL